MDTTTIPEPTDATPTATAKPAPTRSRKPKAPAKPRAAKPKTAAKPKARAKPAPASSASTKPEAAAEDTTAADPPREARPSPRVEVEVPKARISDSATAGAAGGSFNPTSSRRRSREPTEAGSLRFVAVARALAAAARREGWTCPAFRSPPGLVGVSRTIRRRRDGPATVAVVLRGRPWAAVLGDMVEGVVVANGLQGTTADRCRNALWRELREVGEEAA